MEKKFNVWMALLAALALVFAAGCDNGTNSTVTAHVDEDVPIEAMDTGYIESDGTYYIYTEDGLKAWATAAATDTSTSAVLHRCITLLNEWTPVGNYTGTFDGNEHTIYSLYINSSGGSNIGFFWNIVSGSKVSDLTLASPSVEGWRYVGAIAGSNSGTIENCTVLGGTVTGSGTDTGFVGGIVGYNMGTVSNCENSSIVYCPGDNVGGIAGWNTGMVSGCNNSGTVTSTGDFTSIGAIVGNNTYGTVENCRWLSSTADQAIGTGNDADNTESY